MQADFELSWLTITSQMFEENALVMHRSDRKECVIVDPGLEPERIVEAIQDAGLTPEAILCTHGHADHIAGNASIKEHWPEIPLIIGHGDEAKLADPTGNLSAGFGLPFTSPPADRTVAEGDILEYAGLRWIVRETPGHSSGHVVFVCKDATPTVVVGGDVLFAGSVGRTDFPDSDTEALFSSIREKLFPLPDETVVLPGHGPETTIGKEKRTNPFVGLPA